MRKRNETPRCRTAARSATPAAQANSAGALPLPSAKIPELFQVVVQCRDEAEQREVYERLTGEGRKCRLLML